MSEIDLNELMATFADEAADEIAALESGLLALEDAPDDQELKHELLRRAHTIKGNASCVGLSGVTEFAHAYEELLERVEDGSVRAGDTVINLLLSGIDTLRRLIAEKSEALSAEDREFLAKLQVDAGADASRENGPAESRPLHGKAVAARTMRVAAEKLNRMLDLAGEIAIARGRVHQLLGTEGSDFEALIEIERQVDQLQGELQELIMRARMVPVGALFRSYARMVRDLAASHGKNARLITSGEDVEVDSTAVEMLRDPLTHMIRNAIDHGIEPSPQRLAAGKPAVGHITLEARHEAGSILIRVSDDGSGLDRRAIAARATALGLDTERLADAEIDRLIFETGFSTAGEVTDLSGRGVGMDVVRRGIETLRGTVGIASRAGEGTTFTIRLPLTLAVIDGFRVSAAGESYVIPMEHVVECLELPATEREDAGTGVLLLRDEIIPYVRLKTLFDLRGGPAASPARGDGAVAAPRENVLIVQHENAKAGFVVDELHGSGQAVIKPLGNYFDEVPGIAGSSILGNGQVALILDAPAILRNLEQERESA